MHIDLLTTLPDSYFWKVVFVEYRLLLTNLPTSKVLSYFSWQEYVDQNNNKTLTTLINWITISVNFKICSCRFRLLGFITENWFPMLAIPQFWSLSLSLCLPLCFCLSLGVSFSVSLSIALCLLLPLYLSACFSFSVQLRIEKRCGFRHLHCA